MTDVSRIFSPAASRVFGVATIAAPVLLLASTVAYLAEDGINDGVIGGMVGIWSAFALAVSFAGIYRMIESRAPRIGPIFGAIAIVAFTAGTVFNLQAMFTAAYGTDLLADVTEGGLPGVPSIAFLAFLPWGLLAPVSFVATGILLWRTRVVATWSAAALVLGGVLFVASRPQRIEPLAVACDVVLLVALVPIGWAMLARRPVVAEVMRSEPTTV